MTGSFVYGSGMMYYVEENHGGVFSEHAAKNI